MNDYNNVLLMSIVSNHCNMSPEDLGYVTRGNFFCNLQGNAFCRVASCRQAILETLRFAFTSNRERENVT
jgi:hypothetical protein